MKPLYLTRRLRPVLRRAAAATRRGGFDEYVSDPAKPVPYVPRPVRFADGDALDAPGW